MEERTWLARYAAVGVIVVGGLEWLFGRVVSRFAAIPPLEGIGRTIVESIGRTGLFLVSTAFILAAALFFLTTFQFGSIANRHRSVGDLALALYLTLFGVFLVAHAVFTVFSVFGDEAWLNAAFNILSLVAVWWVTLRFVLSRSMSAGVAAGSSPGWAGAAFKIGTVLVALAYSGWYYSVLASWLRVAGPDGDAGTVAALRIGELCAVLAPIAFFSAIAIPASNWRHLKRWTAPLVTFLLFSAGNVADIIANQGFTGVFAIWSVGFTLWLPWPIYAVSIALFMYAVLTCFASESRVESGYAMDDRGIGLLLLLFAGFYLQLTYQHLLAILALLLLTGLARPLATARRPQATRAMRTDTPHEM
jgi:hypothetical protein